MRRDEIRLALLEMTYNAAHGPVEAVAKAKVLEDYVREPLPVEPSAETPDPGKAKVSGKTQKTPGNSILD